MTSIELNFFNALRRDYECRGAESFFTTLFLGEEWVYDKKIENKEILSHLELTDWACLDPKGYSVLMEANWLWETKNSKFIGKYKKWFVGVSLSGEVFGIGQEIQNLPFNIMLAQLGDNLEEITAFYKKNYNIDYNMYLEEYKKFCQKLGLEYKEDLALLNTQSKELEEWLYE